MAPLQAQHAARPLLLSLHGEGSAAERPQRILTAQPCAEARKQTLQTPAAADLGRRLIHHDGAGSSPVVTQDARTASAPPQCLLCARPPVRHEPVGFVGEASGLEGKSSSVLCFCRCSPAAAAS